MNCFLFVFPNFPKKSIDEEVEEEWMKEADVTGNRNDIEYVYRYAVYVCKIYNPTPSSGVVNDVLILDFAFLVVIRHFIYNDIYML